MVQISPPFSKRLDASAPAICASEPTTSHFPLAVNLVAEGVDAFRKALLFAVDEGDVRTELLVRRFDCPVELVTVTEINGDFRGGLQRYC
jgi:hypothetical protein